VIFSRIIGTGSYVPDNILTNQDLEKKVDTHDAWIVERTGIRARHIALPGQTTTDLAEQAARNALAMAGLAANQIDLIILATTTPDRLFPSTACLLQQRLGIDNHSPAFDLQAVCTGFLYALSMADSLIQSGKIKTALVLGAEVFSRLVDWTDRNTCVLFGDGAGAVVLRADSAPGIHSTHLHADGHYFDHLTAPAHIANNAIEGEAFCVMRGREVFKFAVNSMTECAREALAKNHLSALDVDWLVPHQANIRIVHAVGEKLGIDPQKVIITLDRHGNTSAASVPLALDTAVRDGRIVPGHKLLLEAMGGGFTWGSALITL